MQMFWLVRRQIFRGEGEESDRRAQARRVFWVLGMEKLLLQMNKSSRDLNEPFVEQVVFVARTEPEIFEDIVCFVVLLRVETGEVTLITRVEAPRGIRAELLDEGRDTGVFFHRAGGAAKLFCAALCLASV